MPPFSSIPGISSRLASRSPPTDPPSKGELASHLPIRVELASYPPIEGELASRNPVVDELVSPPPIRDELVSHPPIEGELGNLLLVILSKMSLFLLLQSK